MGLLISYSFSLQRNCDPESSSWKTLWLHEEAEWRDPGLHLDPFCDPSSAWTWWAFRAHPPAFTSQHFFPRSDWNCDSVWLQGRHWRSFKSAFTGLTQTSRRLLVWRLLVWLKTGLTQNWACFPLMRGKQAQFSMTTPKIIYLLLIVAPAKEVVESFGPLNCFSFQTKQRQECLFTGLRTWNLEAENRSVV